MLDPPSLGTDREREREIEVLCWFWLLLKLLSTLMLEIITQDTIKVPPTTSDMEAKTSLNRWLHDRLD